jgi:hypothetical protein
MEAENLAGITDWKIVTNNHGTALIVTCPLCGHKLTYTENSYLLVADSDAHSRYVGEAIEHCLRRHLGSDQDYAMSDSKRVCTAPILLTIKGIATRHIVLAYDGRYWLETETYDSRFDMHDWELEVITTAHADWLEKRIKVQSELIRTALIDYQTLLTIQEKVTKEKL